MDKYIHSDTSRLINNRLYLVSKCRNESIIHIKEPTGSLVILAT